MVIALSVPAKTIEKLIQMRLINKLLRQVVHRRTFL
jgi:hypothetical protein